MEYDNAPVLTSWVRRRVWHPHPPTEVLLPFVRWLYGTPSPDTPPYGLLPNMSESSGTPGENSPGFSRLVLRGEPPKVDCNVMGQEPTFA
jgi:hypothetical protein